MDKYNRNLLLITTYLFLSSSVTLADNSIEHETLSLADILNIEVSVSTKTKKVISDSPGIITAYKASEIEDLGYTNIWQLANITSGYGVYEIYGEKVLETRGQKAGSWNNNKHLIVYDGIPVMHARGDKAIIGENLSIFGAERVEFLKGPASSLYGTGALLGVVNIISRELKEEGSKTKARLSYGTQNEGQENLLFMTRNDHAATSINFAHHEKDASEEFIGDGSTAREDYKNLYFDNEQDYFVNAKHKILNGSLNGLSLGVIYSKRITGLGTGWMGDDRTAQNDFVNWENFIPYFKYNKNLNSGWKLESYYKHHRDVESSEHHQTNPEASPGTGKLVSSYNAIIIRDEIQSQMTYSPGSTTTAIIGINLNETHQAGGKKDFVTTISGDAGALYTNSFLLDKSQKFNVYSLYGQIEQDFSIMGGMKTVLGLRLDRGDFDLTTTEKRSYSQTSPRIGIVQKLSKSLNLKFLYSTAYRSPTIKDVGINAESAKEMIDSSNIDDISPESLTSLEIGLSYNTDKIALNTTFFSNETTDALNGKQISDSDSTKYNVVQNSRGKTISKGIEFELKTLLSKKFTLTLNYSMADSEAIDEDDKITGLADVSNARYNMILTYKAKKLTYSFISRNVEGYTAEDRDRIVSGYNVFDIHVRGKLNKMYSTQFSILNLADEEVRLPLAGNKYMPVDKRKFYASLSYHY